MSDRRPPAPARKCPGSGSSRSWAPAGTCLNWPGRGLIDAGEVRLVLFGSGVTTAPAVAAESLKCSTPGTRRTCLGSRKSAVAGRPVWDEVFTANDGVEPELARLLELVESGEQDVALSI